MTALNFCRLSDGFQTIWPSPPTEGVPGEFIDVGIPSNVPNQQYAQTMPLILPSNLDTVHLPLHPWPDFMPNFAGVMSPPLAAESRPLEQGFCWPQDPSLEEIESPFWLSAQSISGTSFKGLVHGVKGTFEGPRKLPSW